MSEPIFSEQQELIHRVSQGDERAFREMYNQYQEKVYFLAWKLLNSETEAKDVLQEIFLKLWLNREKLADVERLAAYLNTIVRNHIYDRFRAKAMREVYLGDFSESDAETTIHTPIEQLSLKQLEAAINGAVEELPAQQKRVFLLSRVQNLKHEEIAEQLEISRETVKKHIVAALQNIKTKLAATGVSLSIYVLYIIICK